MAKRIFYVFALMVLAFLPRIAAMEGNRNPSKEENDRKLVKAVLKYRTQEKDSAERIENLLRAGANPNQIIKEGDQIRAQKKGYINRKGLTLLEFAIAEYLPHLINILIDGKADLNTYNEKHGTPLHLAIYCAHADTVKKLVTSGADSRRQDADGFTAREYAEKLKASPEIIDYLQPTSSLKACTNCTKQVAPFVVLLCLALLASMMLAPSEF